MSKPRLIRRYKVGEITYPADHALERMATDEELRVVWRVPARWSYLVRDPTGAVAATGDFATQEACEDDASAAVGELVWEYDAMELGQGPWRLLLWPPDRREGVGGREGG